MIGLPGSSRSDWIELFNNTNDDIDLGDFHLSDDVDFKKHWKFPEGTVINANDYLIVWADRDIDEEGLHTDFKLSKSAGELFLMHSDLTIVDAMNYEEQTTNVGYARVPNGTGNFVMQQTTFGSTNEIVGTENISELNSIKLTPNPVNDLLKIETSFSSPFEYRILTDSGVEIFSGKSVLSTYEIPTAELVNGVYFIEVRNREMRLINKFIKIE